MIRIADPMMDAAEVKKYYFPERSGHESDYWFLNQEHGVWTGKLLERLEISGTVQQRHFDRMCDHLHPFLDTSLTPRKKHNRRVATDISFHVPKSVSMVALMNQDERVLELIQDAARETLALMEERAGTRVRRNKQNFTRQTGEWAAAMFLHTTARPTKEHEPPDAHLHVHAVLFNVSYCEHENQFKALDISDVYRDLPLYEAIFHSKIGVGMERLGYGIERRGLAPVAYEIGSITRAMIWKMSRRTQQILAEIKRLGITDPKVKGRMGEYTRLNKNETQWSPKELMKSWWSRLTPDEELRMKKTMQWPRVKSVSAAHAIDAAIEHCFTRQSVVHENRLLEYALRRGVGSVTLDQVQDELNQRDWWSKTDEHGRRTLTTPEMANLEQNLLDRVRGGRNKCKPLGELLKGGKTKDGLVLDKHQIKAAKQLLSSTDKVSVFIGKAGVGKTTTMVAVREAVEASGKRVIALAPSAEASRGVQREEGFKDAETVATYLDSKERQWASRDQVLWCDEASMLGVKDMDKLLKIAAKHDARIIFSGDPGQHRAVNAGDALRLLVDHSGSKPVRLGNIRRQSGEFKRAVQFISDGNLDKAWQSLEKIGAIVEHDDEQRRHHELAREYVTALRNGESVLAISPTHAECLRVVSHIRQHLKVNGLVNGPEKDVIFHRNLHWTTDQKSHVAGYEPGQQIYFHKAAPGIKAGSRFTVWGTHGDKIIVKPHGFSRLALPLKYAERYSVYQPEKIQVAKGDVLRISQNTWTLDKKTRLNNGGMYVCRGFDATGNLKVQAHRAGKRTKRKPRTLIIAKTNGFVNHGTCLTSHMVQGKTSDVTLAAIGPESLPAASWQQFYVTVSRARRKIKVFCSNKERVKSVVEASDERMLATELIKTRSLSEKLTQSRLMKGRWLGKLRTLPAWSDRKTEFRTERGVRERQSSRRRRVYDSIQHRRGRGYER